MVFELWALLWLRAPWLINVWSLFFYLSSFSRRSYLGLGRLRAYDVWGLRAFRQSLSTDVTFVLATLDGRTADRCTPACGYRSVRLDRVPLQESRRLD